MHRYTISIHEGRLTGERLKVGVIGLGLIGLPIASELHAQGYEVFSWTRVVRNVPWINSIKPSDAINTNLDYLIVASGQARPSSGTIGTEIDSTYALVEKNFKHPSLKIIYLSSGAVYGECHEAKSELVIAAPSTIYGFAKLQVEQKFNSLVGENHCALRIGNVVDWASPYGLLKEIRDAAISRKVKFFGDPADCRDYVSIDDLIATIISIINLTVLPNLLNVGSGNSIPLSTLESLLRDLFEERVDISWSPLDHRHVKQTRIDVSKLRTSFGVKPTDPLVLFESFLSKKKKVVEGNHYTGQ